MRRVLPLVVVVLLAAGCSKNKPGEKVVAPLPSQPATGFKATTTTAAAVPSQYQNGDAGAGKSVFTTTAGCAGCHTLKDAGATGNVGPNLDDAKPALSLVVERVTKGKGAMPSFKGRLSDKLIADVAAYVVKATGGSG